MNIGIDMMGGDFAPLEAVKGLQLYLNQHHDAATIFCIGQSEVLLPLLTSYQLEDKVHLVHAEQVIGYNEHPTKALKEKPNSSIGIGFQYLATGKIDAFISAGNTGAMLVGTMFSIKPIQGVLRPTIGTVLPQPSGKLSLLLDAGLNTDCKPEYLQQFAILGSIYAKNILQIADPTVGLVNIGEEEGKGNALAQAAYNLLKETPEINFAGNVEGRDFFADKCDVFVCDGFVGNIVLKLAESFYSIAASRNLHQDAYIARFHYENYGGTPVLGVAKPVIIGHGISSAIAFQHMIRQAEKMIQSDLCGTITQSFKALS